MGNIISTVLKAFTPIMKFVGLVLGTGIKLIFKTLSFTFNLIKNIVAFTINPIGFAWDVIRRRDPGEGIDLDQVANAKGSEKKPDFEQFAKGGKYVGKFFNAEVITGNADENLVAPKVVIQKPNVAKPEEFAVGGIFRFAIRKSLAFFATGMIAVLKKAVAKLESGDKPEEKAEGGNVKVPYDFVKAKLGIDPNVWDTYRNTIGAIESGNNYLAKGGSNDHYDGRYQMGAMAKSDGARLFGIEDPGHNPVTRLFFRRSPQLQENLFAGYTAANMSYLTPYKEFINQPKLDQMAILGYAHNTGWNAALKWLETGQVSTDGFGTKSTKFYDALKKAFGDPSSFQPTIKPSPIVEPTVKPSKEDSDSELEMKDDTQPTAEKGNLLDNLENLLKKVGDMFKGVKMQSPLTPPSTVSNVTDYSNKIKTSAQQQKDLENGAMMAGNIVPVSVPVPINNSATPTSNPVQIFTPLHPAIHK